LAQCLRSYSNREELYIRLLIMYVLRQDSRFEKEKWGQEKWGQADNPKL
jgi:hypothetical protein